MNLREQYEREHNRSCEPCTDIDYACVTDEYVAWLEAKAAATPDLLAACKNQLGAQNKIFTMLNAYAKKEHLKDWQCLSLEGLIAQVYGDLAAHNAELRAAIAKAEATKREG